jgi:archaellum biogenesis protein FlaJ (TadC family)
MTDVTENKGAILFYTLLMLLISSVCILKIGGPAGLVVVIIYCVMIFIISLGTLAQITKPGPVGMQMGIIKNADDLPTIDLKKYDEYIHIYDHRMSSIWFWIFAPLALAWPMLFLIGGFTKIAYISFASIIFAEIGKYRVYKAIKDNKQTWGAAAYINEIRNFFSNNTKG